jgi:glycine cleavage system regulatory protein
MLAVLTISLVMALGTANTGWIEKVVLVILIGGCVYAAAKVTTLGEWFVHRLARR